MKKNQSKKKFMEIKRHCQMKTNLIFKKQMKKENLIEGKVKREMEKCKKIKKYIELSRKPNT